MLVRTAAAAEERAKWHGGPSAPVFSKRMDPVWILVALTYSAMPRRSARDVAGPTVICLLPTRELATQVHQQLRLLLDAQPPAAGAEGRQMRSCLVLGGAVVGSDPKLLSELFRGVDAVVATPGRLLNLLQRKKVHLRRCARGRALPLLLQGKKALCLTAVAALPCAAALLCVLAALLSVLLHCSVPSALSALYCVLLAVCMVCFSRSPALNFSVCV